MSTGDLQAIAQRLEAVTSRLENLSGQGGAVARGDTNGCTADSADSHPIVTAYDDILNNQLKAFITESGNLGAADVKTHVAMVSEAFKCQRQFVVVAAKCSKPASNDELSKLLMPTGKKIEEITAFREKNRRSEFFNHLSAISESIPALGWVTMTPAPGPYVKEMSDAGMFYTNRVLKEFKEKNPAHATWVKCWLQVLSALQAYIKAHHTTGISWNVKGAPATLAAASPSSPSRSGPPPPCPGGMPPPPPPPPPAIVPPTSSSGGGDDSTKRAALFSELNKGESVTSGLRKVTSDMQTHKNPTLRKGGVVPDKASDGGKSKPPVTAPKPGAKKIVHPPVMELQGNKWVVEYHTGNKNLVVNVTEMKQTVYIYKCVDSTIQVKGKVNSVVLDSCKKSAIVVEDLISALDVVNCQSVQTQVMGKVPTVNIDKTDGVQVYLSKESVYAEIITAKSSEMNILIPNDKGEFSEFAVPEQFKTRYNGTKLVTDVTESV